MPTTSSTQAVNTALNNLNALPSIVLTQPLTTRNLTITAGSTVTFNSTAFSYGTGAAAAHRAALGLTTLATTIPAENVAAFLDSPTPANLAAAVTDKTGTGSLVFGTSPTINTLAVRNNSASFTPISIGTGGTQVATVADNVNAVSGLQMGNVSTGIGADFRFLIKDTTNHYFAFSQPGTGNNLTLFGLNRNATDYIFNAGGTARDIAIGTADAKFLILATNATERLRVSATGEVGIGTTSPSTKALLEISSTTKGFLPPRMTTAQRDAITSVPAGLMIYNTSTNKLNFYNGTAWEAVTSL
jgi:hypothetical protein